MRKYFKSMKPELLLFFILIAAAALGNGLSDSVYANYFNEVYHVTATQRGFIEFPRELPGFLCAILIALLSPLGDLRAAVLAQIFACIGLIALGLLTPSFGVMLIFLFINSTGMHLFMPLRDSIGMSLAEPDRVGQRMGQYASVQSFVAMGAGLLVFFGFRTGFFSFQTDIKWIFICGAAAFVLAIFFSVLLAQRCGAGTAEKKKIKFTFRKEYKFYYFLTVLHGVQKQIAYVYGSWVIINLLSKTADVMALLMIASSFICIFFMNYLGRWMDKFGIKRMMYVDALSFIIIYIVYGFVVWRIASSAAPASAVQIVTVYALFVLDRLSMQIGIVKSVYLRKIAWSTEEVTRTLSAGTSLDHIVSIIAAAVCGVIWSAWGPQWVFFVAAFFSLGNLFVAWKVRPDKEIALAEEMRARINA